MSDIAQISEWPDYNANPRGGDPITQDLTSPYDKGDLAWMAVCTILCWQITPAVGFLYAGMHRRKAALTMVCKLEDRYPNGMWLIVPRFRSSNPSSVLVHAAFSFGCTGTRSINPDRRIPCWATSRSASYITSSPTLLWPTQIYRTWCTPVSASRSSLQQQ